MGKPAEQLRAEEGGWMDDKNFFAKQFQEMKSHEVGVPFSQKSETNQPLPLKESVKALEAGDTTNNSRSIVPGDWDTPHGEEGWQSWKELNPLEKLRRGWSGKGIKEGNILAQASEDNPYGIGAGGLIGGTKGGGFRGLLSATIANTGAALSGQASPGFLRKSPLYSGNTTTKEDTEAIASGNANAVGEIAVANQEEVAGQAEVPGSMDVNGYPVESGEKAQEFRDAFRTNRDLKARTFAWTASDGIEREYSTQLADEDADEWNRFLQETTEDNSASATINEQSEDQTIEEVMSSNNYSAFNPSDESKFGQTNYDALRQTQCDAGIGHEFENNPVASNNQEVVRNEALPPLIRNEEQYKKHGYPERVLRTVSDGSVEPERWGTPAWKAWYAKYQEENNYIERNGQRIPMTYNKID